MSSLRSCRGVPVTSTLGGFARLALQVAASLLMVMWAPSMVDAAPGVWTTGGPYGGAVTALAIDPMTPATVYAGTVSGGIFKSTNSGGTWTATNTGLTSLGVATLAIDPRSPPRSSPALLAGSSSLTDFGGTWAAANAGLPDLMVHALAIDPAIPPRSTQGRPAGSSSPSTPAAPGPLPTWA